VDTISKEKRSKIMRSIKSKNTRPELLVRKALTKLGYRYRLHKKGLPGKPDIVFIGRRKVIFVHGCFWHGHTNCRIARTPDIDYWREKITMNQKRDLKVINDLFSLGWEALILWECELGDMNTIQSKLEKFLGPNNLAKGIRQVGKGR